MQHLSSRLSPKSKKKLLRNRPGDITEVIGVIGHPYEPMEGESFARALCRFDSGVVSTFETDYSECVPQPSRSDRATLTLVVLGSVTHFGPDSAFKVIGDRGEITWCAAKHR